MDLGLPACTEQATHRFELFSPVDGRMCGTLDGVVHTCDGHAQTARDGAEAIGMSAWTVYGVADLGTCGRTVDFRALPVSEEEQ